jgi:hypothetical protein
MQNPIHSKAPWPCPVEAINRIAEEAGVSLTFPPIIAME